MSVHLEREIQKLKRKMLSLSALVDEQLQLSVRAVVERDNEQAGEVRERDAEVDRLEVEVEEECLKILALHQPVAIDLRFIISVLKINNDLERIGDLTVNISRKTLAFEGLLLVELPFELQEMSRKVQAMLRDALDALVNFDAGLAEEVCARDNEVDAMKRTVRREVERAVCEHPDQAKPLLRLAAVTRNLERIADLATNIAEDAIYMIEGKIVRHKDTE